MLLCSKQFSNACVSVLSRKLTMHDVLSAECSSFFPVIIRSENINIANYLFRKSANSCKSFIEYRYKQRISKGL